MRVGVRVAGVNGVDVVAGGDAPPQLPQSVQSVPTEQNFGSSHMLSFAYLQVSPLPPGDATGVLVGIAVARVGARVLGVAGADVEDEHVPHVFGQVVLIMAPCVAWVQ